jgi:transposase-like protein
MALNKIYTEETAARKHLERLLWPEGPFCPHCGNADKKRIRKLAGESTRPGVYKCNECEKPFSVTVGTVFERSHVPLHKWVYAAHLLTASKKGISSHQLMRMLDVSYKTAWFMAHRIREGMRPKEMTPMGGSGMVVEADETYFGNIPEAKRAKAKTTGKPFSKNPGGFKHKRAILALVERGGRARTFHMPGAYLDTLLPIVRENIARESRFHTDESRLYTNIGGLFATHETVKHSDDEYVRGDVATNTVEGYFSIFKRGMKGVYQHCSGKHLHRYLSEFDFRYNNRVALGVDDEARAEKALQGISGKRLTYRRPHKGTQPSTH